jgi:hypothetical protein
MLLSIATLPLDPKIASGQPRRSARYRARAIVSSAFLYSALDGSMIDVKRLLVATGLIHVIAPTTSVDNIKTQTTLS